MVEPLAHIDTVTNAHQLARNDIGLIERTNAEGKVRLAARETKKARIGQQLDGDPRVQLGELRKQRHQYLRAEPIERCQSQHALDVPRSPDDLPVDGERLLFLALRRRAHGVALFGEDESFRRALEELGTRASSSAR